MPHMPSYQCIECISVKDPHLSMRLAGACAKRPRRHNEQGKWLGQHGPCRILHLQPAMPWTAKAGCTEASQTVNVSTGSSKSRR